MTMSNIQFQEELSNLHLLQQASKDEDLRVELTEVDLVKGGFSQVSIGNINIPGKETSGPEGKPVFIEVAVKRMKVRKQVKSTVSKAPSRSMSTLKRASKILPSLSLTKSRLNRKDKPTSNNRTEVPQAELKMTEIQNEVKALTLGQSSKFVVTLLDHVQSRLKGEYWIVTELCVCDLAHFIKAQTFASGVLETEQNDLKHINEIERMMHITSYILTAVAFALDDLHSKGIIHSDVKEHNILLTASGIPKLADFGLATLTDGDANEAELQTHFREGAGTEFYTAPELVTQTEIKEFNAKVDAWSFGITCLSVFRSVHGEKLFAGQKWRDLKLYYHMFRNATADSPDHIKFYKRQGIYLGDGDHGFGQKKLMFLENFILPFIVLDRTTRTSLRDWCQSTTRKGLINQWKKFSESPKLFEKKEDASFWFNLVIYDIQKLISTNFESKQLILKPKLKNL